MVLRHLFAVAWPVVIDTFKAGARLRGELDKSKQVSPRRFSSSAGLTNNVGEPRKLMVSGDQGTHPARGQNPSSTDTIRHAPARQAK
jgi:hypothetical protein